MQFLHVPSLASAAAFCRTVGNPLDMELLLTVFCGAGESS
jgi:hypothetical protein